MAHCIVEQVKLRGPFLSYADFTNRRVQANKVNVLNKHFTDWEEETRESVIGLRGAVQAAIAEAEINQGGFYKTTQPGLWSANPQIPQIPPERFQSADNLNNPFPSAEDFAFVNSIFGIHAFHQKFRNEPDPNEPTVNRNVSLSRPIYPKFSYFHHLNPGNLTPMQVARLHVREENRVGADPISARQAKDYPNVEFVEWPDGQSTPINWRIKSKSIKDNLSSGEAPDNLLAVENAATGANKPGWLMQSDVLSPLAPVSNVRSDTFVIRVMGETWSEWTNDSESKVIKPSAKAWIELTVQRTPDYVKADLDPPHRRPHEPFEDRNFNGYWDDDPTMDEHWLDLNENGDIIEQPDLPGVGNGRAETFRDGFESDLQLASDPDEELVNQGAISIMGINQRFGRKFKIIRFRWLREQEV